jgi:pimeloyl-ACP methyl ester carboxylesterase
MPEHRRSVPPNTENVRTNGVTLATTVDGEGPAVLLVHGFPHTRMLWSEVMPDLARTHRVIAPDLRGVGGSTRASDGYDAVNLAADLLGLLDALHVDSAAVVAIDAGVPPAFVLALQHSDRVRSLVLMESTLGALPGAENFFRAGAPWWFGFQQVPGLAERVLTGHEGEYLDFFYRAGTHDHRGLTPAIRDAFVASYTGTESLRCAFEYYRAMPTTAQQIGDLTSRLRLRPPTLAIGSQPVGDTLARQLAPFADDLQSEHIDNCGHILPLDQPAELAALLDGFL